MSFYERVRDEATRLDPRKALANMASAPIYGLAWIVARATAAVWWVVSRVWVSVLLGFQDGWGRGPR